MNEVLGAAVGGLVLTDDWRQRVLAGVETGEAADRLRESESTALERKLERLKTLLFDGDLSQREYRAERARVEQELACLAPPAACTDHLAPAGRVWRPRGLSMREGGWTALRPGGG